MSSKRFSLIAAASLAALSAVFAIPAALAAAPAAPPVTALVGGTVVGIEGGPALKDATVLIVGERISQIGPAASTPVPPGAKVISMTGRWLIPGLTNAHVHLGLKLPGAAGDSLALETDTEEVLRMAGNARRFCAAQGHRQR
jgi:imidazolonepropionase-like amidohydrolase